MTRWQPNERANAIGLALAIGADKAAAQTGIPRRTISSWLSGQSPAPELKTLTESNQADTLETMKAAAGEGATFLLTVIRDPKAPVRERVRASEIAIDKYQLWSGGPTAINANLNVNADWAAESEAYQRADPELQQQARDYTVKLIEGVLTAHQALELAGIQEPSVGIDGLQVRAELSKYDISQVRRLLAQIAAAQGVGASPGEILEALTAGKSPKDRVT